MRKTGADFYWSSTMKRTSSDLAALRRETVLARNLAPLDRRIETLRDDIRRQLRSARGLKAGGAPPDEYSRVLALLCRTLRAERRFRNALRLALLTTAR